jgi:hypothetical protein
MVIKVENIVVQTKIYLIIRREQMLKKKLFLLFCLPFILGLFMLSGCGTVTPVAVTGVTLDQPTMTLTVGGATGTLVATVAPADATNQSVTWSSSAPAVATVANGVVTPLTAGTTNIIVATVDGGLTATCTCTVIVNPVPVAIGDSYGGGIVAYILQSGDDGYEVNVQHGLIAAIADASLKWKWSNIIDTSVGTTGTAIGTGQANTTTIVGQNDCTSGAAKLCDDLTEGGYSDWFLPSKDELNQLYLNQVVIGGFVDYSYWSSSEDTAIHAWAQGFDVVGPQYSSNKYVSLQVRAVRAF